MEIKAISYPRAALIGNPSDGYFGKTIAFVFSDFSASVTLEESEQLIIVPADRDQLQFDNLKSLYGDIQNFGYYGGIRLFKAALKRFYEFCSINSLKLEAPNFTLSYSSNVPNRLGLAGSSAIITACMKALMQWYKVEIEPALLANLVLSVEKDELGIGAGLQDRVAQAFGEPVYMDFEKEKMLKNGVGTYEPINLQAIEKQLFIAYHTASSEGSEVVHNDLRERYDNSDNDVVEAIAMWGHYTDKFKVALADNDLEKLNGLINSNYDLRERLMFISPANKEMVSVARSVGASAKFTGSGGAIIGLVDEVGYGALKVKFEGMGIALLRPQVVKN